MLASYKDIINQLESGMLTCPSKKFTNLDCPGCGLQRSVIALLKGDVAMSWQLYPPALFIIVTLLILGVHLTLNERVTLFLLKISFIITVIVMTVNYIYKIANHQLL